MFLQRRKDIYKVCQKHDIIILEDEPYYFLQMEKYGEPPSASTDLLSSLIPSFMSLDVDGRVLRLDSLSKVLPPLYLLIADCCPRSPSSMDVRANSVNRAHTPSSRTLNPSTVGSLPIRSLRPPSPSLEPFRIPRLANLYPQRIHSSTRRRSRSPRQILAPRSLFMDCSCSGDVLLD